MKNFFIAFMFGSLSINAIAMVLVEAELNHELTTLLATCNEANILGMVACPVINKYTYPQNFSLELVVELIKAEIDSTIKTATTEEALDLYSYRLADYYDIMDETADEMAQIYQDANMQIIDILRMQSKNPRNMTFTIDETYAWASVNASAALVINAETNSIYEFIMGDIDG